MGHSAFFIAHRLDTERYDRCVGKVYPFAEIALLDLATGKPVPVGQVGHVGMKSPTLALGYWNDSVNTFRTRLNGYYLTGDLMYQDSEGYYYHVDRANDALELADGNWLYTALSEERILARCPDVRDCSVIAVREPDGTVQTEVLLVLAEAADPAADREPQVRAALGGPVAATVSRVLNVPEDGVLMGPTGKVRKFLMRQAMLSSIA
jgi:acyl-coenzyme A synthetase/AMP-(fatty) acid ligase